MKRRLTRFEIALLVDRNPTCSSEPVYNFLGTLPDNTSSEDDIANLERDAQLYGWNGGTINAIWTGIEVAFGNPL